MSAVAPTRPNRSSADIARRVKAKLNPGAPVAARARTPVSSTGETPLIAGAFHQAAKIGALASDPHAQTATRAEQPHDPMIAAANAKAVAKRREEEIELWAGGDSELHSWERQPGEGPYEFSAFLAYLNIGPGRTIRQGYLDFCRDVKQTDPNRTHTKWTAMASRWGWVDRADAWDIFVREQELAKTRKRMTEGRERRYIRREEAQIKLYELIGAMDPNIVELRAGDLFRAVAILNDDERQDIDRVVEKHDDRVDKNPVDLIGGAMNFATLIQLANQAQTAGKPIHDIQPSYARVREKPEPGEAAIDADFHAVGD